MKNWRILRNQNAKISGDYFYINAKIWGDFKVCISVPWIYVQISRKEYQCFVEELNTKLGKGCQVTKILWKRKESCPNTSLERRIKDNVVNIWKAYRLGNFHDVYLPLIVFSSRCTDHLESRHLLVLMTLTGFCMRKHC